MKHITFSPFVTAVLCFSLCSVLPKADASPPKSVRLTQGQTYQISVPGASGWKSSDKKVATVSSTGLIKAKGTRSKASKACTISTKVNGINYKISCKVDSLKKIKSPYNKNGVHIKLYQGKFNESGGKCIYYAAHVQLEPKAYNKMHLAKANGKRSNGFQTIYKMVHKNNNKAYHAVLAVNGPFNGKDSRKWNAFGGRRYYSAAYHNYHEIYGGKYASGTLGSKNVTGEATYASSTGYLRPGTAQEGITSNMSLKDAARLKRISDTFGGDMGFEVLSKNKVFGKKDKKGLRQRTFIGTNGKAGDFWIVVANGRNRGSRRPDGYSDGLNTYGEGTILKRLGCNYGYNLDGGGSSTMIYQGKTINKQSALRTCYDALYIQR